MKPILVLILFALGFGSGFSPGIQPGRKIPGFGLHDQNGVLRDFKSLKGRSGLVMLFYRSADW
jgi:hypothetical protein